MDLNMKFSHVFPIYPILCLRLPFYQTSTLLFNSKINDFYEFQVMKFNF